MSDSVHLSVPASPETVHWGYFDSRTPAIASLNSGDRARIETVNGSPEAVRDTPFPCAPQLLAIHSNVEKRRIPGHICTGPIEVQGAKAGQVLQIDIEEITLTSDWGYAGVRPLAGALPQDFHERHMSFVPIDRQRGVATPGWAAEIPLRPFFGVLAVAPPAAWGELSTRPPRQFGGNIDNKEMVAGTTLYLPIFVDGALFSAGDGHGVQGDGEICTQALETDLTGTFRLSVRDDMKLTWPVAETPTHIITMAFDPNLGECVKIATRQMIDLLVAFCGIERYQAYTLLSFVGDLRVTQVVNDNNGVHLMVEKRYFGDGAILSSGFQAPA